MSGIRITDVTKRKNGTTVISCGIRPDGKSISWLELELNKSLGFWKGKGNK